MENIGSMLHLRVERAGEGQPLGINITTSKKNTRRVEVESVAPETPGAAAGLQAKDHILTVAGEAIFADPDIMSAVAVLKMLPPSFDVNVFRPQIFRRALGTTVAAGDGAPSRGKELADGAPLESEANTQGEPRGLHAIVFPSVATTALPENGSEGGNGCSAAAEAPVPSRVAPRLDSAERPVARVCSTDDVRGPPSPGDGGSCDKPATPLATSVAATVAFVVTPDPSLGKAGPSPGAATCSDFSSCARISDPNDACNAPLAAEEDKKTWFEAPFGSTGAARQLLALATPPREAAAARLRGDGGGAQRAKPHQADARFGADPSLWLDLSCCGIGLWLRFGAGGR